MTKRVWIVLALLLAVFSVRAQESGTLAFISNLGGGINIFLLSGGEIEQLTDNTDELLLRYAPIWSPDGTQLAVLTGQGPDALYLVDAETGEMTLLVDAIDSGGRVSWSPDGEWLAFDSGHIDTVDSIFIVRANGEDYQPLTDTGRDSGRETFPAWSPDGEWVAYEKRGDLWKINVESQETIQLTDDEFAVAEDFPVWSPDGERILFIGENRDDADNNNLYIINADGSERQTVVDTDANEFKPTWSPDGDYIAYRCGFDVCRIRADGGDFLQLTDGWRTNDPIWSPDGAWIAFLALQNDQSDIFQVPADGGEIVNLTDNQAGENAAQWYGEANSESPE